MVAPNIGIIPVNAHVVRLTNPNVSPTVTVFYEAPGGTATTAAFDWIGGFGTLTVAGNFDGATINLQRLASNGVWIDILDASGTANYIINLHLPAGNVRIQVTGGTAPSAIFATLERISNAG